LTISGKHKKKTKDRYSCTERRPVALPRVDNVRVVEAVLQGGYIKEIKEIFDRRRNGVDVSGEYRLEQLVDEALQRHLRNNNHPPRQVIRRCLTIDGDGSKTERSPETH